MIAVNTSLMDMPMVIVVKSLTAKAPIYDEVLSFRMDMDGGGGGKKS